MKKFEKVAATPQNSNWDNMIFYGRYMPMGN